MGAEFADDEGRFFCHEDCLRAARGLPSESKRYAEERFGDSSVFVGYALRGDGRAGVCAACLEKEATIATDCRGRRVGVCSGACADELGADLAALPTQQIGSALTRRMRHKTYRQSELRAAVAWLWLRAQREGPGAADPYGPAMREVFHVLPAVVGDRQRALLHVKLYDTFAQFARCSAELGARSSAGDGLTRSASYARFRGDSDRESFAALAEDLAIGLDARSVASILFRQYTLYWRVYYSYARRQPQRLDDRSDRDRELMLRPEGDCKPYSREHHAVRHDVAKVLHKLVRVQKMPQQEALDAFVRGLYRSLEAELPALGGDPSAWAPEQVKIIRSAIGGGGGGVSGGGGGAILPPVPEIGPELWESFKRRLRLGTDKLSFGKKYSATTVTKLLYNLYLVNSCMPEAARNFRKLNTTEVLQIALADIVVNGRKAMQTIGFRRTPTEDIQKLTEFGDGAQKILRDKEERAVNKGREGRDRSETQYAKLCGRGGEYDKRHAAGLDRISSDLAREVIAMAVHWHSGRTDKRDPKTNLTQNQTDIRRDIEGMFDDLLYRTGRAWAASMLLNLFDIKPPK